MRGAGKVDVLDQSSPTRYRIGIVITGGVPYSGPTRFELHLTRQRPRGSLGIATLGTIKIS